MYKLNDVVEVTESFDGLINPFSKIRLSKGRQLTITDNLAYHYIVKLDNRNIFVPHKDMERFFKIVTPTKRYSKVIETGLSYGQAMDKLTIEDRKVAREKWSGYWVVQALGDLDDLEPYIVAQLKDGGHTPASPYQSDMFARDWMVVE